MTDERLRKSAPDLKPRGPRRFRLEDEPTQTIDLVGLFTTDITSSGSFDVKDGIWATTFGKLLQSLPVPAFLVDERFEVVVANQACSRIYPNYESVQNSPFAELFPGTGHAAKVSELLAEVLRTRKPKVTEALLKIGNGKIWARLTFRSIRISDIRSVLVMVEDLTTEKKLLLLSRKYQQELEARVEERTAELKAVNVKLQHEMADREKAEKMLVQSERLRAVGEMAAGVAHNFTNLIQMVQAFAHGAMRHLGAGDSTAAGQELDKILQSLQHGAETVRRIQDFAKMGSDHSQVDSTVFDVPKLVRQAVEFTKPFWETYPQSRGIPVKLGMTLQDGCYVKGNSGQIFEVVVNLIKNAAEALTQGGEVSLATSVDAGKVVFEIRDTGIGIREADMERLFTPFFTTKPEGGTGLGLATSRTIVHNHGGTITVRSKYGQGTTFRVMLPLTTGELVRAENYHQATGEGRLTILAVDDMESTLMMLKLALEDHHHKVLTALSGEEALKMFWEQPVDLVLCDLAMPGMNGWEVGQSIGRLCEQKSAPRPTFILFTAWGDQAADKEKMAESGVDAIIEKPVEIPALLGLVRTISNQRGLAR